jgi:putative ABC transport system permease protein
MYHFLDQSFGEQYQADQQFGNLFTFFSCLSIFIACLGLFGLSSFMAQQRVKEIGIRKVLGSTPASIVMLLSKDFIKLVTIAILISVPLCWWVMNDWLRGFAYRIRISPIIFLESGLIALSIALATMTWQSLRAAMANPVRSLRNE